MQQVWGGGRMQLPIPSPYAPKQGGGEGNLGQEEERGPWGGKLGQMGWELWEHGALLRAAPGGKHIHGRGGGGRGCPQAGDRVNVNKLYSINNDGVKNGNVSRCGLQQSWSFLVVWLQPQVLQEGAELWGHLREGQQDLGNRSRVRRLEVLLQLPEGREQRCRDHLTSFTVSRSSSWFRSIFCAWLSLSSNPRTCNGGRP